MFNKLRNYITDDEFRISIYNNKINIVNYTDLITLESDRVTIKEHNRIIIIKGNNLVVNRLLDNEILIIGDVKSIELGQL